MDPLKFLYAMLMDEAGEPGGGGAPAGQRTQPRIGLPGRQQQAQPEPQEPEEYEAQGDQYEDQGYQDQDGPQGEPQAQPESNWREQALKDPRVQARFDEAIFGKQEQQAPEPQEDPLDAAQRELDEIEAEFEQFGGLKPEQLKDSAAVTRYFELSDKRGRAASRVSRLAADRSRLLERRQYVSQAEQSNYQQFAQQDPNFTEEAQGEFRQYLKDQGISQELMADPAVFQTVAKSFLYEKGQQGGRKQRMPAPPLGQGHSRQPAPQQPQEPVDPQAAEKDRFWGTSRESISKHTADADGRPLKYDKSGHDVPYLRYSDTGRRRRRSA